MRFVLINVEGSIVGEGLPEYRMWPHLGLLTVGTRIQSLGLEVLLWDELVQGQCQIEHLVQPGDILGLSLVATGIERGAVLAYAAKRCGVANVIAGNDAALFRASQLLMLPDSPFDAVCTSNSLDAVEEWVRSIMHGAHPCVIQDIATRDNPLNSRSNERSVLVSEQALRARQKRSGEFRDQDVFEVPNLSLYSSDYWETVFGNYREMLGSKHQHPALARNALALFAQGCTRTGGTAVCSYCTIAGVADVRMPERSYLERVLQAYADFGITHVFNVTDSSLEMLNVARQLLELGARFPDGLTLYGRAWGLAHRPDCIEAWQKIAGSGLVINSGFDSGSERMLATGVVKASVAGNRLRENFEAVRNVQKSGARLHCSFIFGIPGETRETCEETLEFFRFVRETLGTQLQQCESDFFWLNHGSPASRVFHDFEYAQELAQLAGKEISAQEWGREFHAHRDTLVVPSHCQEAWYRYFTHIEHSFAHECIEALNAQMRVHAGAVPGRKYAYAP